MSRLLASNKVRLYLIGDTSSNFGDFALFLAAAIWVRLLTGSVPEAGLTIFAFMAGSALLPVAGLVVDRVARRPLLIGVNLLLAAFIMLLLLVRGRGDVWLVYVVMFGYGAFGSVLGPAQAAILPAIVDEDLLGDANGLLQATRGMLRLFSPVVGAGLFAWVGMRAVVAIDAATFVVAALTMLAISVTEPPRSATRQRVRHEISSGLRFIMSDASLRQLLGVVSMIMLVLGFFETICLAVVTQGLHHAPTFLGVLAAAQAVGTIAGGVTGGGLLRRFGTGVTVMIGLVLVAGASLLLTAPEEALVIAAIFILGTAAPFIVIAITTALQRQTPGELQGRVMAAFEFGVTVPQTISIALGAGLIARFNYRALLIVVAAVVLVALGYLAAHPAQRAGARQSEAVPEPATVPADVAP
jgi:MFS family permease